MPPAAYAKRPFRTRRYGVKEVLGMPARSACKPAGGRMNVKFGIAENRSNSLVQVFKI
jgi:hypothetical protein